MAYSCADVARRAEVQVFRADALFGEAPIKSVFVIDACGQRIFSASSGKFQIGEKFFHHQIAGGVPVHRVFLVDKMLHAQMQKAMRQCVCPGFGFGVQLGVAIDATAASDPCQPFFGVMVVIFICVMTPYVGMV
ncbi:hypothetical protein FACS1894116_01130 [Betaproteobacteria bacterium]|nr:hypothetical protein FACS1894116_01130 [Betaproteobacteria bacterium]GHU28222.1 hypothetical protein FACS189497_03140 [Betaproteobacteria bacterium]